VLQKQGIEADKAWLAWERQDKHAAGCFAACEVQRRGMLEVSQRAFGTIRHAIRIEDLS
jgi:hypothetical protein